MTLDILYSFRRCPFAIRARWALMICGIKVEIREVDLKNKPPDLINISKNQTVPFLLKHNGDTIEESLEIVLWALTKSNNEKIKNKYLKKSNEREIFDIISENDNKFKFHLDRFKYSSRFKLDKNENHFNESFEILKKWNRKISKNKWLIGDSQSIADWCLWPFVRQYKIACESQKKINYLEPPMRLWLEYFENHKNFQRLMYKYKPWQKSSNINHLPTF